MIYKKVPKRAVLDFVLTPSGVNPTPKINTASLTPAWCCIFNTSVFAVYRTLRPLTLIPVLTTARRGGLKRGCRGRREHSVNVALDFQPRINHIVSLH